MIRKIALAPGAATLIAASPVALALDGASVELGRGDDRANLLRISFVDKWRKKQPPAGAEWRLAGYWDLSLAVWDNPDESTAEVGFTPVFRIERGSTSRPRSASISSRRAPIRTPESISC
ncbi:MAG TPA: hypothetical protein VFT23_18855 [Burkholderiales bacterium]|nr:hypothetical protein [Burkholderiales bacterium]